MRSLKTLRKLYDEESHLVITEKGSPPRVLFSGEDFLLEDLPLGSRIIYPGAPLEAVPNLKATIRYALNHPLGMVEGVADRRLQPSPGDGTPPCPAAAGN